MTYAGDRLVFDADSHVMEQAGDDLFMFSSDYPHPEGTKDPIQRFESTLDVSDAAVLQQFYSANFASLYRGAVPV